MWRAIDGMNKDVQELVQRDAGTEDEEDTKPSLVVENPTKEEPAGTSTIAQLTLEKTIPAQFFFSIPEENVVSVKDSVSSGLPAHESLEGMEVG